MKMDENLGGLDGKGVPYATPPLIHPFDGRKFFMRWVEKAKTSLDSTARLIGSFKEPQRFDALTNQRVPPLILFFDIFGRRTLKFVLKAHWAPIYTSFERDCAKKI